MYFYLNKKSGMHVCVYIFDGILAPEKESSANRIVLLLLYGHARSPRRRDGSIERKGGWKLESNLKGNRSWSALKF